MRAALINFVNDGALSGGFGGNVFKYANNNKLILSYGLQILKKYNITINDATNANSIFISKMLEIQNKQSGGFNLLKPTPKD